MNTWTKYFPKSVHMTRILNSAKAATCSHLQPLAFPLAAFPRRICNILRWTAPENSQHSPVGASGCKWLQVAASVCWEQQVACKWLHSPVDGTGEFLGASGCKWLQVAAQVAASGCKWLQVAASGCKWLQGSLLEANFCHFAAPRPAIEFLFWDHWETAVLGQILAGSLLEANFCHLVAARSKWLQVAASGCKWLQVAAGKHRKKFNILRWKAPENFEHSPVDGTGEFSTFSGGSKWLQVAASGCREQVAIIQGQGLRAYHPRCSRLKTSFSSVASKMIECQGRDLAPKHPR